MSTHSRWKRCGAFKPSGGPCEKITGLTHTPLDGASFTLLGLASSMDHRVGRFVPFVHHLLQHLPVMPLCEDPSSLFR